MDAGFYAAYGLRFRSEVPLPHFGVAPAGKADVVVRRGAVPQALRNPAQTSSRWEAARGDFLLRVDERLRYRVTEGRHVVVDSPDGADSLAAAYLMGTVCTALLQQRGLVTLHASAVCTKRGAVLFLGKSGAGKSTLAAALAARGYPVLTDDVAALQTLPHGPPRVLSGYPNLRLWSDAFDRLDLPAESRNRVRDGLDKYLWPIDRFAMRPQTIRAAYVLQARETGTPELVRVAPAKALRALGRHTHRRRLIKAMGNQDAHFGVLARLARSVPVTRIVRPVKGAALDDMAALVERDLSNDPRNRSGPP